MEMYKNPGEIILRKGEIAPFLFFIIKGSVRIESENSNSFFLKNDDFFGEEGVFLKKPANYTAIASEISTIMLIQPELLHDFFKSNSQRLDKLIGKSVAKTYENTDNLKETNKNYLLFLDKIIAHLSEDKEKENSVSLDISLLNLAEEMGTSLPFLRVFIEQAEAFNHFTFKDNKFHIENPQNIKSFLYKSYIELFLQNQIKKYDGLGSFNLINKYLENKD